MRRVGIVVVLLLVASGCQQAWIELASRDIAGDGANGNSQAPAMSADGRFVAFSSDASDLVPGDTNGRPDVFVRDLQTGAVELVSVGAGGTQSNGTSFAPSISADGNRISFSSTASNLAPDIPFREDVFVRDRAAGTTVSASIRFFWDPALIQSAVYSGAISGDGSTVWFIGAAQSGTVVIHPVLVYDVATATLSMAPTPAFHPTFLDIIAHGSVSHDGRYAAVATFTLPAPEVLRNVYRVDRIAKTIDPILDHDGLAQASPCVRPTLSGDGNVLAFDCASGKVVAGVSSQPNVFVRDFTTGITSLLSVDGAGNEPNGGSTHAALSFNGTRAAFTSGATNLVPVDTNGVNDVFVRDRLRNTTTRVSLDSAQVTGNHAAPSIAGSGEFVAFTSNSNDIVPGDSDGTTDVIVRSVDAPLLLSATPSSIPAGTTTTFTLTGDFFQPDATVSVSGSDITVDSVVFISSTESAVTVTVGSSAVRGVHQLSVLVPGPGPGINGRPGSSNHCKCLTVA
jgi:Tol biopolymer transport system component